MATDHRWGRALGWFVLGATLGVLTASLVLRKAGEQPHARSSEHATDLARRAHELATEAQGLASEWFDKSRDLVEEQTQRLKSAFEAGREAMREELRRTSTTRG